MEHPFLTGLADGSLEEASFRYYIAQDSLYLRCGGGACVRRPACARTAVG